MSSEKRILIVENEGIVALNIKSRLEQLGYAIAAIVSSGEAAIEAIATHLPDLVLMDIRLGGNLDGIEVAAQIRDRFNLPVVYLTAYADPETLERAKITEPYGYILKPFEIRELNSSIEIALYKHRMEQELKQRERWLATTLRSIGDAVITTDASGIVTFMNPIAEKLTGWQREQALGRNLSDIFQIIDERTRTQVENPASRALQTGEIFGIDHNTLLVARDGTEIPIDDSAAPIKDEAENITGSVLVFHDIIERKQAELALRESEQRFRGIFDQSFNFIWLLQPNGIVLEANQTVLDFTQIPVAEISGRPFAEGQWWPNSPFLKDYLQVMMSCAATGELVRYEAEIVSTTGASLVLDFSIKPVTVDRDRVVLLIAEGRDISDRKHAEATLQNLNDRLETQIQRRTIQLRQIIDRLEAEVIERQRTEQALRFSEESFRHLAEVIPQQVWTALPDGRLDYVNQRTLDYFNCTYEQILGWGWQHFIHPEDRERCFLLWERSLATGAPYEVEFRLQSAAENLYRWHLGRALPLRNRDGQIVSWFGTNTDIHDRKQFEIALKENEEKFRSIFQDAPIGMGLCNRNGQFTQVNPAYSQILGYTEAEFKQLTCRQLTHPEDWQQETVYVQQMYRGEINNFQIEKRYLKKTGEFIWTNLTVGAIRDSDGNLRFSMGMVKDISERKQAEEELRAATLRLSALIENLQVGILFKDELDRIVLVNQAFCDLFKIVATPTALIGADLAEFAIDYQNCFVDPDRFRQRHHEIIQRQQMVSNEELQLKNGRVLEQDYVPIGISGQDAGHLWIYRDITERKRTEFSLRESLREKEVLLKEIHHRVKNNLQIISSLLKLQSNYIKDLEAKSLFTDSYNRVRSMALIHEKLYSSENLAQIEMSPYISSLVSSLLSSYNISSNQIHIFVEVGEIVLEIDRAIPCGLIITELVSNALKYAFPDRRAGEIQVYLLKAEEKVTLIVKDNGIGLPLNFNLEKSNSLGLQLVHSLIEQLEGKLAVESQVGTCFEIGFYVN